MHDLVPLRATARGTGVAHEGVLLGAHVGGGAAAHLRPNGALAIERALHRDGGDAKVNKIDVPRRRVDHDVVGLDVLMQHTTRVDVCQRRH